MWTLRSATATACSIHACVPRVRDVSRLKHRIVLSGSVTGSGQVGNGVRAMKSVCVFCGSSSGNDEVYSQAARALGKAIADRSITLVYGGTFLVSVRERGVRPAPTRESNSWTSSSHSDSAMLTREQFKDTPRYSCAQRYTCAGGCNANSL